jgi:hypothetical protein
MQRRTFAAACLSASLLVLPIAAQVQEPVDLGAVHQIKTEATQRSRVMEFASFLTDIHGPRLTNSPQIRRAAEYVKEQFAAMGLANPRLEPWGPFGRGWTNDRTVVLVTAPQAWPVLAFPKAWTPGTKGAVTAAAIHVSIEKEQDFEKYRGALKGKAVLVSPLREVKPLLEPPGRRYTHGDLEQMSVEEARPAREPNWRAQMEGQREFRQKRMAFFVQEGVVAILEASPGTRGDSGSVLVGGPGPGEGSRDPKDPAPLPQLVLSIEHYGRIARTLERKLPVTMEIDVRNRFFDDDLQSFNVLADIPGGDAADEIVMLGAHFDSWHTGTGATDNGGSSAVVMEAMRILKASGLKLRRTVRAALWTGEEQGLLGSRAYVKEHFADRETMALKPEHAKLAAYFNMDNGGGAFRGVYLQGNDMVAPIFRAWMEPFRSLGMTTLTIRNTSGTDHLAFDAVGLPGFQFIQDPLEYSTRTHHTNLDQYERLIQEDLIKNAMIMASFAYHAANRPEPLPRKPLPPPAPEPGARPTPTASAATAGR